MAIFNLFSKRQKKLRGDTPDVFTYEELPEPLRVQIIHIWREVIGDENDYHTPSLGTRRAYQLVVETLCREYGVFRLPGAKAHGDRSYHSELWAFLLQEEDYERILDAIELTFRLIDNFTRKWEFLRRDC
jgi:hypothetical protein